ncbi:MAG: hypothetical protein Q8K31_08165 [Burkholderiaceae bacterium]|nr:hypothetical protein [Burkholderiaceae bacterium]MDO9090761.1 hypothetical protein [Burkholderiaceae bacterium]MDP1969144.1 hypothetical protein [Burkholderiaceae bacterium]
MYTLTQNTQANSVDEEEMPVTLAQRCRAEILAFYDAGQGRQQVDLFSMLYSLRQSQPATVEMLRDDRLAGLEPAVRAGQKSIIRKKLATQFERALRNKMVCRVPSERRALYQLTDRGNLFIHSGLNARTALYKLNFRYSVAYICSVIANDELQVITVPEEQGCRRVDMSMA